MGEKITLKLDVRSVHGKKVAQLRKDGIIPGVLYGQGMDPIAVQASIQDMEKVVREAGRHSPISMTVDGKKKIAMIKEVSVDPARHEISHVAFHAVKQNQPITAVVPIVLVGGSESEAEKAGLIVLQNLEEIEVKALPMDLPEALELDTSKLKEAGEKVLVKDIAVPANVEIVDHSDGRDHDEDDDEERQSVMDFTVATVWEPSAIAAQNEAAAGDAEEASAEDVPAENGEATEEAKAE